MLILFEKVCACRSAQKLARICNLITFRADGAPSSPNPSILLVFGEESSGYLLWED